MSDDAVGSAAPAEGTADAGSSSPPEGSNVSESAAPASAGAAPEIDYKAEHAKFATERETWQKRLSEFEGKAKQAEARNDSILKQIFESRKAELKALGFIKDEPEKPLTRAEVEKLVHDARQESTRQLDEQRILGEMEGAIRGAQEKHPGLFDSELARDRFYTLARLHPEAKLEELTEAVAKSFEEFGTGYMKRYADGKAATRSNPPVTKRGAVPGGPAENGKAGNPLLTRKGRIDSTVAELEKMGL